MARFKDKIKPYVNLLMDGVVLAVDPSSGNKDSRSGWAIFKQGELVSSGTIPVNNKLPTVERIRQMCRWIKETCTEQKVDIFAIEMLRAGVHTSLRWAVGAFYYASDPVPVVEVPAIIWHRLASVGYIKSDEKDAVEIGKTAIWQAKEWQKAPKTGGTRLKGLGEQKKSLGVVFKSKKKGKRK